jgi:ribonucleoside-diphosphate reductase alpha chain
MTRPQIVDGKTKKAVIGCGTLYLTLNFVNGKPFELFLNGSKMGGCRANQESISRLATLAMKHDIPTAEIIDQLSLIKCPACTRAKAKLNQEEMADFPTSCGDAVAKFLKEVA